MFTQSIFSLYGVIFLFAAVGCSQSAIKFDFGPGKAPTGYSQVIAADIYGKGKDYGFEPGANVTCSATGGKTGSGYCASDKPFYFSTVVPEGNYRVTVTLGSKNESSVT